MNHVSIRIIQPAHNEKYRLPYFYPNSIILLSTDNIVGTISIPEQYTVQEMKLIIKGQIRRKIDKTLNTFFEKEFSIDQNFSIPPPEYPAPSYYGTHYDCRYTMSFYLIVGQQKIITDRPFYLLFLDQAIANQTFSENIGIESVLHMRIALNKATFDVNSDILGVIAFGTIKIKVRSASIHVFREELFDNHVVRNKVTTLIYKYEILDGPPVRGDLLPIRLFLGGMKLWTFPDSASCALKVKYFFKLIVECESGTNLVYDITNSIARFSK